MYKLLLVFASAAALKRPQRALAVRGGEIDPIQIGKGIVAASGVYSAFDPKGSLEKYGCKNIGKSGETLMRASGLGQLVFAAALNMDTDSVHGQIAYHMLASRSATRPSTARCRSGSSRRFASPTVRSSSSHPTAPWTCTR